MIEISLEKNTISSLFLLLVNRKDVFITLEKEIPYLYCRYKTFDAVFLLENFIIHKPMKDFAIKSYSMFKLIKFLKENKIEKVTLKIYEENNFLYTELAEYNLKFGDPIDTNYIELVTKDSFKKNIVAKIKEIKQIPINIISPLLFLMESSQIRYRAKLENSKFLLNKGNLFLFFSFKEYFNSKIEAISEIFYYLARDFYFSEFGWKIRYDFSRFRSKSTSFPDEFIYVFESEISYIFNPSFFPNQFFFVPKLESNILEEYEEPGKIYIKVKNINDFLKSFKNIVKVTTLESGETVDFLFSKSYLKVRINVKNTYVLETNIAFSFSNIEEEFLVRVPAKMVKYLSFLKNLSNLEIGLTVNNNFFISGNIEITKGYVVSFYNFVKYY